MWQELRTLCGEKSSEQSLRCENVDGFEEEGPGGTNDFLKTVESRF